jgi:hypothetical protein
MSAIDVKANKPTPQQQIEYHRTTIAELHERVRVFEVCGLRKSAAHWRGVIASCESCIRACERRIAGNV